ncbi:hypothetical protein R1flu_019679 [Riccia fluitans]|uniref:RNA-directed RNA polymerase n=1 Tax=Riccia fluitans TaxID=41844 RepID=A0ABD1ZKW9_9MARC
MEFLRCLGGHVLCPWDRLYFYEQIRGSGDWHLIVRPEWMELLVANGSLIRVEPASAKKSKWNASKILCPSCERKVATESSVGPNEELFYCFDYKNVRIQLNCPPSKWKLVRSSFPGIEEWSGDHKFGSSWYDQIPFVAPRPADFQNLDIAAVTRKTPRNYQIELFVRASMENSIIFLPTGTGKTLVAVMVVKFLSQLNRGKVGIFLAHRIPLIQQQAKVLEDEGNLKVKVITGENSQTISSSAVLENICSDFEVLALTAQVFLNLILNGFPLERCSCIVFDEAHNAAGDHTYMKILRKLSLCALDLRPRILGLTASPAGEPTFETTYNKVEELCHSFCSASVIMPVLWAEELLTTSAEAETEYTFVHLTPEEIQLQRELWEYFYDLWDIFYAGFSEETRVQVARGVAYSTDLRSRSPRIHGNNWTFQCRGVLQDLLLRFCSDQEQRNSRDLVERMYETLVLIDESRVHGVSTLKERLILKNWESHGRRERLLLQKVLSLSSSDGSSEITSTRVKKLIDKVRSALFENPTSRILVFVNTRFTAGALEHILAGIPDMEKLRPSRLVGQNGFDGMSWEEHQKPMLERFRSGIVQLLIATSVLEEGIDVPTCNLVIRFDGMNTVTGNIQSRGRARLRESKFVVLLAQEDNEKVRKLHRMEADMQQVVKRKFSLLGTSTTNIVNNLIQQKDSACPAVSSTIQQEGGIDANGQGERESFVVRLKFNTSWLTESVLRTALREYADVLKYDTRCSLLYLGSFPGQDADSTYRTICLKVISQILQRFPGEHLWFQKCATEISTPIDGDFTVSKKLQLRGVFAGMFKDPSTFLQVYSPELRDCYVPRVTFSEELCICWDAEEGFLSVHIPQEAIVLEFTQAAIDGWILIHHDEEHTTHRFYIPLRQAPKVYSTSPNSSNKRLCADVEVSSGSSGPKVSFLNILRHCLVLELVVSPRDRQEETVFKELVENLEGRGVLRHDSRVVDVFSLDSSEALEQPTERGLARSGTPSLATRHNLLRKVRMLGEHLEPGLEVEESTHFGSSFLLDCIFSQQVCKLPRLLIPQKFFEILYCQEQLVQERSLLALIRSIAWFCDPVKLLEQAIHSTLPSVKGTRLTPRNFVSVFQVTVTPSRIIFYEPLMMKSSRLLRHFDPENFLKVSFRDENMGFIPGNESKLLERVYDILQQGIRVAGRLFMFLGCSSSMLRSHSCWMTSLNPNVVRSWLGDFREIRCVGKYMARVGLGMAASDETITLEDRIVDEPISDFKQHNFCFSDGVGKISSLSLQRVLKHLYPKGTRGLDTVTAVQIRVAGYKGVVALDPTLPSDGMQCQLRKSMHKFPSTHRRLEVLNVATGHPVYLNRQGIVLLSCLGVEDSTFERLQEEQLQDLLRIFLEDQSQESITKNCHALKLQLVLQAGIHIPTEPFLQHILSAVYFQKIQRLVTKTHIFVPDGRLLMGVIDETDSLNYGEIYVKISDKATDWQPKLITGSCVTYKNPCFHPGDVRVLKARDIEGLRHLVNCVVFPAKGPRPHTDEMSGSDLDGDSYTVIWMPGLLPSETFEPMSYDVDPPLEVPEVRDSDMFGFFVKAIASAELGLIANSHLALADSRPLGAMDEDCIALAKLHAKAVDFPKTGHKVTVKKSLIPSKYPDFMEKYSKATYPSPKLLGRLYRRAKCLFGDDIKRHVNVRVKPDNSLLVHGFTDCMDEARETYRQYCTLLRGLMQCYGVEQEAEIVTGCIVTMLDHFSSETAQWTEVLKQQFKELVQTFRERFFACASSPEQRYKLASACYMAAYADDDEDTRCLSFPWVVSDVLAEIKHNKLGEVVAFMRVGANYAQSLEESVYHSMRGDFIEQHPAKFASLLDRRDLLEKVETCVSAVFKNASVRTFGSSSTYLFEPSVSDVDLCVKMENHPSRRSSTAQIELLDQILPCLRQDFPETFAIKDARVPILKNDSGPLAFDITVDDSGLRKAQMVLAHISICPALLLVLTVVVRWGRNIGLIASQSRGQFTAFSITWLVIQFCLQQGFLHPIDFEWDKINARSSSSPSALISVIEEVMDPSPNAQKRFRGGELPSEILLNFFRHYADLSVRSLAGATSTSPFRVADPLGESRYSLIDLDPDGYTLFRNRCLQAWHALTRTRSVKSLYVLGERHVCLRLSRFQSCLFRGAEEFHAKRLSSLTGGKARVRISCHGKRTSAANNQSQFRNSVLHVDIHGDPAAVHIVEKELQDLNSGHCWLPTARNAVYVKGATFLLFEGSLSDQDRLGFLSYSGQCHLKHLHCRLHVPVPIARVGGSTWMNHALSKLRLSVWRQRQYLLNSDADISAAAPSPVHGLIRFGTLYATNVPFDLADKQSIRSVSVAELEEFVVRGKKDLKPGSVLAEGGAHSGPSRSAAATIDIAPPDDDGSDQSDSSESPDICAAAGPRSRRSFRRKKVQSKKGSVSLVPHIYGSLEKLLTLLRAEGFQKLERNEPGKYLVAVFTPKEWQIRLNSDLEFISLSRRPIRWLCGSLLFDNEDLNPQPPPLSRHQQQQEREQRPNCVRFYIRTHRQVIEDCDLKREVLQKPLLEFPTNSGPHDQTIRVGPAFRGRVGYVRWIKKESWINVRAGVIVKIIHATEWEGWNKSTNSFKSHKAGREVEVHMIDTDAHLRGSDMECQEFIEKFWTNALKIKETIF